MISMLEGRRRRLTRRRRRMPARRGRRDKSPKASSLLLASFE
jgi:hypothetical protein